MRASRPCLCGRDSAETHFRRFPWKPGSQHEEGVFPRQLRPQREVTGARLGGMAFPGAELLQLSMGKWDASASSQQLLTSFHKAFALLLQCACRP